MHSDVQRRRQRTEEVSEATGRALVGAPEASAARPFGVRIAPSSLAALAARFGGDAVSSEKDWSISVVAAPEGAGDLQGVLVPVYDARSVPAALEAVAHGAALLVDPALSQRFPDVASRWVHPFARWAAAKVLGAYGVPPAAAVVGRDVVLGAGVVLYPGVVLGDRVVIGANSVLGAPGFGFVEGPSGPPLAIPHLAGLHIGNDVRIGALCTIDAGAFRATEIGVGAALDAQVHVGHHARIGAGAILCAQSGLAGSVTVGAGAILGGQVGVADHVTIGERAKIAAKSGVIGDVPAGETWGGYPAQPRLRWLRGIAASYRTSPRGGAV
mgnify:CR=1 FL=1